MRFGPSFAVGSALVVLTGCAGFATPRPSTGPEVLAEVVEALEDAGSVRIEGTTAYGDPFDVHVQDDAAVGTVGMGADYDAPIVSVDGTGYLLPPDGFWPESGASEEDAARLRGRYMTVPGKAWRGDLPRSTADVVEHFLPAADEVAEEVGHDRLDGAPVLVLTAEDGSELSVDAAAPHRPVRLVLPGDDEDDRVLRFTDFGKERTINAPDDPITPEEIEG